MAKLSISALFSIETAETILSRGLELAAAVGLPVTSWRAGDPTRSYYKYLAETLANLEGVVAEYIKAGFLSSATGDWLSILGLEVYGVERPEATFATPTVTITNGGGGFYQIENGDASFSSSVTGKTYRNIDEVPVDLPPGATVTLQLIADEEGSGSTAAVDEIDTLISSFLGVTVDSSTAAAGTDQLDDEPYREQCRATLGALSPNGPSDAYEYVARNSELTGVLDVSRATSSSDALNGTVTVYIAGGAGPVAPASVTAVQAAIEIWATPLTVTPTVVNATGLAIDLTVDISGDDIPADFATTVGSVYASELSKVPIGGLVSVSTIIKAIHLAIPEIDTLTVSLPAADVQLSVGVVATSGTVIANEV